MNDHQKRLYRSKRNRVFAGVAGGIGHYFNIDPTIVRLITILLFFFIGPGVVLLYILAMLFMPQEPNGASEPVNDEEAKWLESRRGMLRTLLVIVLIAIAVGFAIFGSLVAFYHPWGWHNWGPNTMRY